MGEVLDIFETARKHNLPVPHSRELVPVPAPLEEASACRRLYEGITDWAAESLVWCLIAAIVAMFLIAVLAVGAWFVFIGASILIRIGQGWLVYSPILIGVGWWVGIRGRKKAVVPERPKAALYVVAPNSESPPPAA